MSNTKKLELHKSKQRCISLSDHESDFIKSFDPTGLNSLKGGLKEIIKKLGYVPNLIENTKEKRRK